MHGVYHDLKILLHVLDFKKMNNTWMNNDRVTTQRKHGGSIVLYQAIMFRGEKWMEYVVCNTYMD